MAIPTGYTETSLAEYMHGILGPVATAIGWSVAGGSYAEAVNETLLAYPVEDVTSLGGTAAVKKLRALARVAAWRAVVDATVAHVNLRSDQTQLSRSQLHEQARQALAAAQMDAAAYDDTYRVGLDTVVWRNDPYIYLPDEERVP